MKEYKPAKGIGMNYILAITILYDAALLILSHFVNFYEVSNLINLVLIVFNIYQFYYIIIYGTLKYYIDEENIYIYTALRLKRLKIPIDSIISYQKSNGYIKGVKLSGYGKNNFAIGRAFIDKVGITYMFTTSTKNVIYLRINKIIYGISPEKFHEFEKQLLNNKIMNVSWEDSVDKNKNAYRNKKFSILFLISALMAIIITLNPIILYLSNKIPYKMPINFNINFTPEKFGTGKQFAFKQMAYGLLDMALLFCTYYADFLFAKYNKKYSYKFIYVSLILSTILLIMQLRIVTVFR
ncbi:hypothetical protein J2Z42_001733 [Clostridium algifaecis]|uniref:Bacterial Pleckstrin homology domain-containing protein n=1 Tax=Clostridium algifaecis TaxID=1472040 RepID=A0ABS4KVX4_9CLOT|nr:hypothetical protein [Clostridium algifaecis]